MKSTRSLINKADLLEISSLEGLDDLEMVSKLLGYSYHTVEEKKNEHRPLSMIEMLGLKPADVIRCFDSNPVNIEQQQDIYKPKFYRVTSHINKTNNLVNTKAPKAYVDCEPFSGDELNRDIEKKPHPKQPLQHWKNLWIFSRLALGLSEDDVTIDIDKAVRNIAEMKILNTVPRKKKKTWSENSFLISDFAPRLIPVRSDMNQLRENIYKIRGQSGLKDIHLYEYGFDGYMTLEYFKKYIRKVEFSNSPVLIISDLGVYDKDQKVANHWLHIGEEFARKSVKPIVLAPLPKRLITTELKKYFYIITWDKYSKLPKSLGDIRKSKQKSVNAEARTSIDGLLTYLSPTVEVQPALLRGLRLYANEIYDIGHEIQAWSHEKVHGDNLSISLQTEYGNNLRKNFKSKYSDQERQGVYDLIERYRVNASDTVRIHEDLIKLLMEGTENEQSELEKNIYRLMKTLAVKNYRHYDSFVYWVKHFLSKSGINAYQLEFMSALWIKTFKELIDKKEINIPEEINLDKIRWVFDLNEKRKLFIHQEGEFIVFSDFLPSESFNGSRVYVAEASYDGILEYCINGARNIINTDELIGEDFSLVDVNRIEIKTSFDEIKIEAVTKPEWAYGIGRDAEGLFVQIKEEDKIRKAYWHINSLKNKGLFDYLFNKKIQEGFWWDETQRRAYKDNGFIFEKSIFETGKDKYGYFKETNILNIQVKFRWCPPGEFMMGSPEDESERSENEKQHKVILTRGFWLAETACTQKLWGSVMGKNPRDYEGSEHPVENVSYEDCHEFFVKVNASKHGLSLRLPSEAEWEYACRAGTTTPFSFGKSITKKQVNYNGGVPYVGGKKRDHTLKTVPVKSLPCNDWGFYEMHGNVWEWCADEYIEDITNYNVDPLILDGERYLVRGGGWLSDGKYARCAVRFNYPIDLRKNNIGFRFALGHMS